MFLARATAVLLLLGPVALNAASFDCTKAAHPVEKRICADPELGALDEQLARSYRDKLAVVVNRSGFKGMQKDWNSLVRRRCTDAACIREAYTDQIANLAGYDTEEYEASYKSTSVKSLTLGAFTAQGFAFSVSEAQVDDPTPRCRLPAQDGAPPLPALYTAPGKVAAWHQGSCTITFAIKTVKGDSAGLDITSQGCEKLCPGGIVFDDHYTTSYEPVADLQ